MKLSEMKIDEFATVLASEAPAPGGGSTAALCGALGAALTGMVAALTAGKEKYAEHRALMEVIIADAARIRSELLEWIDRDTEAFNGVSAVFALPRGTEEEKALRREAMQTALKNSTKPPFEVMRLCLAALQLAKDAIGKSNANAASDLGVAALTLKAAVQGAWLNVLINIGGITDEAFAKEYRAGGRAILDEALPLADDVYNSIQESL